MINRPVQALGILSILITPQIVSASDWEMLDLETPFDRAFFIKDPDTSEFFADLIFPYGEAHATGPEGLAHYTEHLVAFNAFPKNEGERFQNDFNASTYFNFTNYYMNSTDPDFVLQYLSSVFKPFDLDKEFQDSEREVVIREYELRFGESPEAAAWLRNYGKLYEGSSMSRSIIGTPESIASLNPDEAAAFHSKYYVPEGATLIVRANMEKEAVEALIDEAFADIKRGNEVQPITINRPNQKIDVIKETLEKIQRDSSTETMLIDPSTIENWESIALVANTYISSTQALALNRKLQFDDKLVSNFTCSAFYVGGVDLIEQNCQTEAKRNKDVPDIYTEIKAWREDLSADNPEFVKGLNDIVNTTIISIENMTPEEIYGALNNEILSGKRDIMDREQSIASLKSVTPEDVLAFYDIMLASQTRQTVYDYKEK